MLNNGADNVLLVSCVALMGLLVAACLVLLRRVDKAEDQRNAAVDRYVGALEDGRIGYANSEARKRLERQPEHPCYRPPAPPHERAQGEHTL